MELWMHLTFAKFLMDCEQIVPQTQCAQASNTVQKLVVDEEEDLHVYFYSDFMDLTAKVEELQMEAAIDSLYIDFKWKAAYLLQSTLGKKHLIQVAGLYFVTSETNYTGFSYHIWKKVKKTTGEHEDLLTLPDLPQYKREGIDLPESCVHKRKWTAQADKETPSPVCVTWYVWYDQLEGLGGNGSFEPEMEAVELEGVAMGTQELEESV
ncbi:hypothetical protein SELMODRAFT_405428 [Selaginella moellendorffii]|uniref:Uncharacterized protein n=1 Tax=Selaginella moellendorffii TaxID=88036 RepID=D8QYJ6_SELML|nr:hypothetical protein SELMODRAFT_405428 [Selaginella moellendorffii]